MGAIIKHTKEDVTRFESEICRKCRCLDICQTTFSDMSTHIPNCPKFFNFVLDYKSFVIEQLEYYEQHPEEAEAKYKRNLELAKQIKAQRRQAKKNQSN